jgi:threonine/homoserine/homoserine lactone efflux protein
MGGAKSTLGTRHKTEHRNNNRGLTQPAFAFSVVTTVPDIAHWTIFLSAAVPLITPGPSVIFVMARAIAHGPEAAVLSGVGLALGDLLQVVATAVGLSALLVSAPAVFSVLKFGGAAYLVALGTLTLIGKGKRVANGVKEIPAPHESAKHSLILQGFLALNPKTALFFLAFLPQFVDPRIGSAGVQILTFGITFVALGLVTNSLFGCLGAKLGTLAGSSSTFQAITRFASGIILIALGIAAAYISPPQHSP